MPRDPVSGRKLVAERPKPKAPPREHGFEVYEPREHKKDERLFARRQPWEPIPWGERLLARLRSFFGIKKRRKDVFEK